MPDRSGIHLRHFCRRGFGGQEGYGGQGWALWLGTGLPSPGYSGPSLPSRPVNQGRSGMGDGTSNIECPISDVEVKRKEGSCEDGPRRPDPFGERR